MSAVAFITKGDTSNCDALWVDGDVIHNLYTPWTSNLDQLMTLSRNDLVELIPEKLKEKVKKDNNKEALSNLLIENWDVVVL